MYPNRGQYKNAVLNAMFPSEQNGGFIFLPVLEKGEPLIASGGNAIVFKVVDSTDGLYALKLFHTEVDGRFERLKTISAFLERTNFYFFSHFSFIENLIYVEIPATAEEDCFFPGVLMKWIDAVTLDIKLKELIELKKLKELKIIAEKFKDVSLTLLKKGIAHGDLKLSNILIDKELNLFLIDYDGMYVPELKNQRSIENGTPSYQHPARTQEDFNSRIDHFSILNIFTSLKALIALPELFEKYNDGDNIIFTKEDFLDPDNSELFQILSKEQSTKNLIFFLRQSLLSGHIYLDNIQNLLNGIYPQPEITINHSPAIAVVGQVIKISWKAVNADFLKINNKKNTLTGFIEVSALSSQSFEFEYGNSFRQLKNKYKIACIPDPKILAFTATETALAYGEILELKWKAKDFKKAVLCYNNNEIDVTNTNKHNITGLAHNLAIKLILTSLENNLVVESKIDIEIFYPINLEVKLEKRLTFPNRPVKLFIKSKNAQKVLLMPLGIDLTGKKTFDLISNKDLSFKILATNKRYKAEYNSSIEVLRTPLFLKKFIEVPKIEFKIPLPKLGDYQIETKVSRFSNVDLAAIKINRILDKLNVFKIVTKRVKYDDEAK